MFPVALATLLAWPGEDASRGHPDADPAAGRDSQVRSPDASPMAEEAAAAARQRTRSRQGR